MIPIGVICILVVIAVFVIFCMWLELTKMCICYHHNNIQKEYLTENQYINNLEIQNYSKSEVINL